MTESVIAVKTAQSGVRRPTSGIPADVPTIHREYIIHVKMDLPEGADLKAFDVAMTKIIDDEAGIDIENALYYDFPEIAQAIFEDGRFSVHTFEVEPEGKEA